MKRLLVFMVLAGMFLTGGIYATRMIKEKSITGLPNTEMRGIYAGVTCENPYPCKKNIGYCRIPCRPQGSYCITCAGTEYRFACRSEGPSGSKCTDYIQEGGCENKQRGHCIFPRTCYPDENLRDENGQYIFCDREAATGNTCPQ